jgi:hypothetical protein
MCKSHNCQLSIINCQLTNGQHGSTFHDGVALIDEDGGDGDC